MKGSMQTNIYQSSFNDNKFWAALRDTAVHNTHGEPDLDLARTQSTPQIWICSIWKNALAQPPKS